MPNFSFTVADPETGSQPKQVYPLSPMSEETSTVLLDIRDVVVKSTTNEDVV